MLTRQRMFGQRITEWGLKKNYSAKERQQIAKIVKEYENRGENPPPIIIRGKPVKISRIKKDDKLGIERQDLRKRIRAVNSVGTTNIVALNPVRPLSAPQDIKYVEIIVHQVNAFYDVNVEARIARNMQMAAEVNLADTDPTYVRPDDFVNKTNAAMQTLEKSDPRVGWTLLNEALEMLKPLFQSRSTYVISNLLDMASQWSPTAPPEVSRAVWRHIADMAATVLGHNEPTAVICNALTHLESRDQIYEATQNSLRLVLYKFEFGLGQDSPPALSIKAKYTRLLVEHGKLDEAERLQLEVVQQRKRIYGDGQNVTLAIYRLAKLLQQKGDLEGAEREYLDALQRSRIDGIHHDLGDRNTGTTNVAIAIYVACDLISCLKERGKEDHLESQLLLEEALARCAAHCEYFGDWVHCSTFLVDMLPILQNVLKEQGKFDEIDNLKRQYPDYT